MKKRFYMMLATVLFSCAVAFGQSSDKKTNNDNGNTQDSAFVDTHIDKLKQDITLTADQEHEIRKLLDKLYKDREQAAKKADKNQKLNNKKLSYETYITALYAILTEEQCAILDRKVEERKLN